MRAHVTKNGFFFPPNIFDGHHAKKRRSRYPWLVQFGKYFVCIKYGMWSPIRYPFTDNMECCSAHAYVTHFSGTEPSPNAAVEQRVQLVKHEYVLCWLFFLSTLTFIYFKQTMDKLMSIWHRFMVIWHVNRWLVLFNS